MPEFGAVLPSRVCEKKREREREGERARGDVCRQLFLPWRVCLERAAHLVPPSARRCQHAQNRMLTYRNVCVRVRRSQHEMEFRPSSKLEAKHDRDAECYEQLTPVLAYKQLTPGINGTAENSSIPNSPLSVEAQSIHNDVLAKLRQRDAVPAARLAARDTHHGCKIRNIDMRHSSKRPLLFRRRSFG